ncbi:MAG: type II secretion system F family protein [Candidatus Riflebacteria bacterium]|nr:type II secretion system F family protein [Candidatus Riflebacteria bacterium]
MPKYDCQIRNSKGEITKAQIEASDLGQLATILSERNLVLVKASAVGESSFNLAKYFGGSVSQKDLMVFTVQLSTLIGASISLSEAMGILTDQTENPALKIILEAVLKDLRSGISFAKALKKHPKVFNSIYCNMIEAGEAGGILDTVLIRLATFAEADSKMRAKIKGAVTLPLVQLIMATGCVIFLLVKIFPNFTKMFKKMKAELPPITKLLIFLSDALRENYIIIAGGTIGIVGAVWYFSRTAYGASLIDKVLVTAPLVGNLVQKIAISRFSRTLSSLLSAGVAILSALKITGSVMGNKALESVVEQMAMGVQQGKGLAGAIKGNALFPPMVAKMMEVGENTGNLDKMLTKIADFYDLEVSELIETLTAAMTPILTVVMGGVIGGIALSVFMPLFSIVQQMK